MLEQFNLQLHPYYKLLYTICLVMQQWQIVIRSGALVAVQGAESTLKEKFSSHSMSLFLLNIFGEI